MPETASEDAAVARRAALEEIKLKRAKQAAAKQRPTEPAVAMAEASSVVAVATTSSVAAVGSSAAGVVANDCSGAAADDSDDDEDDVPLTKRHAFTSADASAVLAQACQN